MSQTELSIVPAGKHRVKRTPAADEAIRYAIELLRLEFCNQDLTYSELAARSKTPTGTLRTFLSNSSPNPLMATAFGVADALGVPYWKLIPPPTPSEALQPKYDYHTVMREASTEVRPVDLDMLEVYTSLPENVQSHFYALMVATRNVIRQAEESGEEARARLARIDAALSDISLPFRA